MRGRAAAVGVLVLGLVVGGAGSGTAATASFLGTTARTTAETTVGTTAGRSAAAPASTYRLTSLGALGPLTDLVIDRLDIGDLVAAAKFGTGRPIDDPVREQQLLDQVHADAVALGLDPDATVRIFRDQIEANKVVQRGLFARWTAHPDEAPTVRPDLAVLRTRLDQLTTAILSELKRTERLRENAIGCHVQLTVATRSAVVLRHLDSLHHAALAVAVPSICSERTR